MTGTAAPVGSTTRTGFAESSSMGWPPVASTAKGYSTFAKESLGKLIQIRGK
jgi:hypothetical protein